MWDDILELLFDVFDLLRYGQKKRTERKMLQEEEDERQRKEDRERPL